MKTQLRRVMIVVIAFISVSTAWAQERAFRVAVQFQPGWTAQAVAAKYAQTGTTGLPVLDDVIRQGGFSKLYPLFGRRGLPIRNPAAHQSLGFDRALVLERAPGLPALSEAQKSHWISRLRGLAQVEEVLPDRATPHPLAGSIFLNDPFYPDQWHHQAIDTATAQAYGTGTSTLTIVVLDTGVNIKHPDFDPNLVISGYDYYGNKKDSQDQLGHGTEVTGVIAAQGNNGIGTAGVAWGFRIMVHNVVETSTELTWALDLPQAIKDAVDEGASVINMSFGSDACTPLKQAVQYAADNDVVLVACMHNHDLQKNVYPAAYSTVIAVGATDDTGARVSKSNANTDWGSNYGPHIDVVAPGLDILTSTLDGTQAYAGGTSFATPQVTALAAMLRWIRPDWNRQEIQGAICLTAQDLVGLSSEDKPGWDPYMGWGQIRFGATVQMAAVSTNCPLTAALSSAAKPASELANYYWLRDKWLLGTTAGKNLVENYYLTGPAIVKVLNEHVDLMCRFVNLALKARVYICELEMNPNKTLPIKAKDLEAAQALALDIQAALPFRTANHLDPLISRIVNSPENYLLNLGIPVVIVP